MSSEDGAGGVSEADGYAISATNGLAGVNGLSLTNGLAATNGLAFTNGLALANGLAGTNGLSLANGLAGTNGLAATNGLMTSDDGRRTVAYLAKCALNGGDSLVKSDQYGYSYTFAGALGLAPEWKNGACNQDCMEKLSACLQAHVNTYGIHYPIWIDAAPASVGWGVPASNYKMEGVFFGNILVTGGINHVAADNSGNQIIGPLGFYCEAAGAGLVGGRVGEPNPGGSAPYFNAFLGTTCAGGYAYGTPACTPHYTNGVVDGYSQCRDQWFNTTFSYPVTVWRDPNATLTFDSGYTYGLRAVSGSAGLALNVSGGNYNNGTQVQNWRYKASNKIGIRDSGAGNGSYQLFFIDNPTKCIDNPGSQTANGTQLQVYDCSSNNVWQQWTMFIDGYSASAQFKNVGSGKCMHTNQPSSGQALVITDCNQYLVNQRFRPTGGWWQPASSAPTSTNDAYVLLAHSGSGNVAIDSNGNYGNTSKLYLASAVDTSPDNRMTIVQGSVAGTWRIKFTGGGGNKCLNNPGGQTANGTIMQVYDCNGTANQDWYVTNNTTIGSINLKNRYSNRCLDDGGYLGTNPKANFSKITVYDCSTTNWAQQWAVTVY